MKAVVLCEKGLEDVALIEINEIIGAAAQPGDGVVTLEATAEQLAIFSYRAQSIRRVIVQLAAGTFTDFFEDISSAIKNIDLLFWAGSDLRICIECERVGDHPFNSSDIGPHVGREILAHLKEKGVTARIDFDQPTLRIFILVVDSSFIIGVDFSGFDLGKREYKIFSHAASLRGTVGYGVLRLAGYSLEKAMLSCFTKSGVFEIEAALFALGRSVHHYKKDAFAFWKLPSFKGKDPAEELARFDVLHEKKLRIRGINSDLRHVSASKKNAKIAGVDDSMHISRIDTEWMDIKFNEGEFDIIIAQPAGHEVSIIPHFFRQAKPLLSRKGRLGLVTTGRNFAEAGTIAGFKLIEERILRRGQTELFVQIYGH